MTTTALMVSVEAIGCPTVCRHCWAQGTPYHTMPVDDIGWVLERAHRFCDEHGLGFHAFPMHEVAAHPDAAAILELFAQHVGAAEFEPLSTTGVPLATREDWRELLAAAARVGTTTVWVAFHGVGGEHDRQVNRPGAYDETCLAVRRIHAAGLRAGCNVFVTKVNAPRAGRLLDTLRELGIDEMSWEPATYYPTPRGRRNERLRPAAPDLRHLADRIRASSGLWRDAWADLDAHTEAAWVRRALAGAWPEPPEPDFRPLELVCRPNLDLHAGMAGLYRERHGNLRRDGADAVLRRALASGQRTRDALWFDLDPPPSVTQLATHAADPDGQGVHFTAQSVRSLWLDRARAARGGRAVSARRG
jgi:hypothetical protein